MTWQDRFRRSSGSTPSQNNGADDIDRETGEILSRREDAPRPNGDPPSDAGATTVQGERAIPSVNRERSIQSRISSSLALGTIVLLGAGFLFWYYNTQYSKTHEAEEAARKAAAARAAGEMKVPPLGRIDPPKPAPNTTDAATNPALPPPPAASAPNANAGPPQKTPEQLALERQLGMPVLRRAQTDQPAGASSPYGASAAAQPTSGGIPSMSQMLGSLQLPGASPPAAAGATLAANLKPTPLSLIHI